MPHEPKAKLARRASERRRNESIVLTDEITAAMTRGVARGVEEGGFLYDSETYNDELPYWGQVGDRPHWPAVAPVGVLNLL